jgi:hypothetical protein
MTIHLTLILAAALIVGQDAHQHMNARGADAMGFDQDQTVHHFRLHPDGGTIEVGIKDRKDDKNRTAIQSHLPHIAQMFAAGDFSMPMFIHAENVPGSAEMIARKNAIGYRYEETPTGGRVHVTTSDAGALAAIHTFMRYQITEHRTGDPLEITRRP